MPAIIAFIVLFLASSSVYAYGARSKGATPAGGDGGATVVDAQTPEAAQREALQKCIGQGSRGCVIVENFSNTCIASAYAPTNFKEYFITGPNLQQNRESALGICRDNERVSCRLYVQLCDTQPTATVTPPARAEKPSLLQLTTNSQQWFATNPEIPIIAVCAIVAMLIIHYFRTAHVNATPATRTAVSSPPPSVRNTIAVATPQQEWQPPRPHDGTIYLKLRRSQKQGVLGRPIFVLNARVELAPEQRALVSKYGLGKTVAYDSKARRAHAEQAYGHFTEAQITSRAGIGRSVWTNVKGAARSAMVALSLRVTVANLIQGQHIECKDLGELLGAEAAIREACENLKAYLETAATFDGREDLIEI